MIRRLLPSLLTPALFLASCALWPLQAQDTPKADNTQVNKRDRSKAEPTADQQKESSSDRELTQKIRQAIVDDKSLSTYAHNVKIIAQNGKVTLKGPVSSAEEKRAVGQKATEVAGSGNVVNEITIKPARTAKARSRS